MTTRDSLTRINAQYRRDPAFEHLRETTQYVAGVGEPAARVMIIGEAPGREEAVSGVPFVGRSGQLLTRLLHEYSAVQRSDCYITNVVKYRPPGNRDPWPEEIEASKSYLRREIVVVEPGIICLLGAHAYKTVFPSGRVSLDHGKPRVLNGYTYLPMLHPANALYDPRKLIDLQSDFKALRGLL